MSDINTKYAKSWIDLARWSPSGGNAQPWKICCEESSNQVAFRLSIDPEYRKKASLMDVNGVASVIALGGFFKSLEIAASNDGFRQKMFRWVEKSNFWESAIEVIFEKRSGETLSSITNSELQNRNTNRRAYFANDVPQSLIRSFEKIWKDFPELKVVEISTQDRVLITTLKILEKIRWQHQGYLLALINEIGFDLNDKDVATKIPVRQLGVSKLEVLVFRWISRKPSWAAFLFRMGFYLLPVRKSVLTFTNECNRIFFLQAPKFDFKNSFQLGVCLQDLWLHAQREGVSFQPCGDAFVALAYWQNTFENLFSVLQTDEIKKATKDFENAFGLDLRFPVMGFRIGFSKFPAVTGVRKEASFEYSEGLLKSFNLSFL